MPDDTSSDESLPSGSHPSAQPEPAARFQSYAEYLACLDRSPFQPRYRSDEEQLWLASFTEDGRYIKRYTCILPYSSMPTNLPAVDVEGISPETTVLSPEGFRTLLQATDEDVSYRIIIAEWDHIGPSRRLEDVLGLGLDLEPEIFDYVWSTVEHTSYIPQDEFPLPWFKDAPALRIGSDVLCILERTPERTSKTAIIFLRDNDYFDFPQRNSLGSTMFSSKKPSQMQQRSIQSSDHNPRYYRKSLVERYITEAIEWKNQFGPGNFLCVCLAALLELQLSTAPMNIFQSFPSGDLQKLMRKYRQNLRSPADLALPVGEYPNRGWDELRLELDHQRHTLRWMPRFFKRHFKDRKEDLPAAFEDIKERFKLRVQDLEEVESQLRDQMANEGINKSIRMAEMSIRKSKRVMLLTALAFVFLPISLASSVYGMNIQQINGTGHSIGAFVITAFAMCASAVVLWAFIAGFQSRRARLKKEYESNPGAYRRWELCDWPIMMTVVDAQELIVLYRLFKLRN